MRRAVAHVFVEDLDRPALSDKDVHHLARVLRLRVASSFRRPTVEGGPGSASGWTAPLGRWRHRPGDASPEPLLTVAFALTKGEHPGWPSRN